MARPKLPWRSPLVAIPDEGQEVWVRRLPWYDTPVLSLFDPNNQVFRVEVTSGTVQSDIFVDIPLTHIHTWKFRFLADEQAAFPPV